MALCSDASMRPHGHIITFALVMAHHGCLAGTDGCNRGVTGLLGARTQDIAKMRFAGFGVLAEL